MVIDAEDADIGIEVKDDLKHWNEKEQALKLLLEEIQNHPNIVEHANF